MRGLFGLTGIVDQKNVAGVIFQARDKVNAFTTLRKSECSRIHDSVRPPIAEAFETGNDHVQRTTPA